MAEHPTNEDFLVEVESALEKQLLPEPGIAVLERTRDAVMGAVYPLVAELRKQQPAASSAPADQNLRDRIEVWPLTRVLAEVRCGSQDWSWDEEWADLDKRHAETGYLAKLEQQIRENGITMPVLVGSDGRLWDGHHRLRIAVRIGIPYVPVEITLPMEPVLPGPADRAAVLRDFLWRLEQSAGDAAAEKFLDDNPDLRRMADEAQQAGVSVHRPGCQAPGIRDLLEHVGIDTTGRDIRVDERVVDAADDTQHVEVVHGCPPDGSGLTPCCRRTPFELPLDDRISSEVPVTCPGADEAQQAGEGR